MRAVESVYLHQPENEILLNQFANACRGDYDGKWKSMDADQRIAFLKTFSEVLINHTNRAFDIGVTYGLSKSKVQK